MIATPGTSFEFVSAERVFDLLRPSDAVAAIEQALRGGFDPATDFQRRMLDTSHGQLLLMPSQSATAVGVKIAAVAPDNPAHGLPRIQGLYIHFDATTLTPQLVLDGTALTTVRTPAVSIAAVKSVLLQGISPLHVAVFGAGPQAAGHIATLSDVLAGHGGIASVTYIVRNPDAITAALPGASARVVPARSDAADRAAEHADVIVCATGSGTPLFDSARAKDDVVVIAVGSHTPDRREVDAALCARAQVVVEDRATALREGGDVVLAIAESALTATELIPMADLITGRTTLDPHRAVFFKSSGMSWEDVVVAQAIADRLANRDTHGPPLI